MSCKEFVIKSVIRSALYPELVTPGAFLIIPNNAMLTSLYGADPSARPYRICRLRSV